MGARADSSVVREGAKACSVEGRLFDDAADAADEGTVVVRRVSADGRSRVTVDGSLASVSELAATVGRTVDLCGQHEHQRLLKQAEHAAHARRVGRRVGGAGAERRTAPRGTKRALLPTEVAQCEEAQHASAEKVDEARFVAGAHRGGGAPAEGEYEELMDELPKRENAEALALARARRPRGARGRRGRHRHGRRRPRRCSSPWRASTSGMARVAQALREACFVLEDVGRDARAYAGEADFDPAELAAAQERAATLQGLMRAYGPRMEDVLERRDEARRIVELSSDVVGARCALRAARLDGRRERARAGGGRAAGRARVRSRRALPRPSMPRWRALRWAPPPSRCSFTELPRAQWTQRRVGARGVPVPALARGCSRVRSRASRRAARSVA